MRTAFFAALLCATALVLPGVAAPVPTEYTERSVIPVASERAISDAAPRFPSAPPGHDTAAHLLFARDAQTVADAEVGVAVGVPAVAMTALVTHSVDSLVMDRQTKMTTKELLASYDKQKATLEAIEAAQNGGDHEEAKSVVKERLEKLKQVMNAKEFILERV